MGKQAGLAKSQPKTGDAVFVMAKTLTPKERDRWRELDSLVRHGILELLKVAEALLEIRDKELFREDYECWNAYTEDVHGMGKAQANRMIRGAEVLADLAPIGAENMPQVESQLRELGRLKGPALRQKAWTDVLALGKDSITAIDVRKAVEKIRTKEGSAAPSYETGPHSTNRSKSPARPTAIHNDDRDAPETKPRVVGKNAGVSLDEYVSPPWFEDDTDDTTEVTFELADGTLSAPAPFCGDDSSIDVEQGPAADEPDKVEVPTAPPKKIVPDDAVSGPTIDTSESAGENSATDKAKRRVDGTKIYVEAELIGQTTDKSFELADGTRSGPISFSESGNVITADAVSGKLRQMTENNSKAVAGHGVDDELIAGRQALLVELVAALNLITAHPGRSAPDAVYWAVYELQHLTAYLRPASDPDEVPNATGEEGVE